MDEKNQPQTPGTAGGEDSRAEQMTQTILDNVNGEEKTASVQDEPETEEDAPAKKSLPQKIGGFFKGIWHWMGKHKFLTLLILIVLVIGIIVFNVRKAASAIQAGTSYSFIRTTTLSKTTLDQSVSTSGTVESGSDASVTVSDSAKLYKVTEVSVAVGDKVQTGDVIVRLDTTDAEKALADAREDYTKNVTDAQTSYDRTLEDYNVAVVEHDNKLIDLQQAITDADTALGKAKDERTTVQNDYNQAQTEYNNLLNTFNSTSGNISTYRNDLATAENSLNGAITTLNSAIASYESLLASCQGELETATAESRDPSNYENLKNAATAMINAYFAYNDNGVAVNGSAAAAQSNSTDITAVVSAVNACKVTGAEYTAPSTSASGSSAVAVYSNASSRLNDAIASVNVNVNGTAYNYAQLESAVKQAKTALEQAENTKKSADTSVENAEKQVKNAHDNYDSEKNSTSLTSRARSVEDAKTKLAQTKEDTSKIEDLEQSLQDCTLTATMPGTITALNATVGSACTGSVATIQNLDLLAVAVTLAEYDVQNVSIGMSANITSDATTDSIAGTVTEVSPVANTAGTFDAKVTVLGGSNGLLVGMKANVDIIQATSDNVFVVPYDAVGEDETGSFVYIKTGGEGANATFEKTPVTAGSSNDYYIEISGAALSEGLEVRSTADLTVGAETATGEDAAAAQGMNGPSMTVTGPGDQRGGGNRGGASMGG